MTSTTAVTARAKPPRLYLTMRELQIVRGISHGLSNAEIGKSLFLAEDTIKSHARRIYRLLGARDRAHAVAICLRAGLIS